MALHNPEKCRRNEMYREKQEGGGGDLTFWVKAGVKGAWHKIGKQNTGGWSHFRNYEAVQKIYKIELYRKCGGKGVVWAPFCCSTLLNRRWR